MLPNDKNDVDVKNKHNIYFDYKISLTKNFIKML